MALASKAWPGTERYTKRPVPDVRCHRVSKCPSFQPQLTSLMEDRGPEVDPPLFEVLYQDEYLVAVDKPAGYHVHPPEDGYRIPSEENMLQLLKAQLGGKWLYPVHRLDRATSGIVVYALQQAAAGALCSSFRDHLVKKTYCCLVRGWTDDEGVIDKELSGYPSETKYITLKKAVVPVALGGFPSSRYSLLKVEPVTGRRHQIRRHLKGISHPILGDTEHGDRLHNRYFTNELHVPGMLLKACVLELPHPATGERLKLQSTSWEARWLYMFDLLGLTADQVSQALTGHLPPGSLGNSEVYSTRAPQPLIGEQLMGHPLEGVMSNT